MEVALRSRMVVPAKLQYLLGHVPYMLVGVVIVVVFTRLVPPSEFGRFAASFAFVNIAGAICFGWLPLALARLGLVSGDRGGPAWITLLGAILLPLPVCLLLAWVTAETGMLYAPGVTVIATAGVSSMLAISQISRTLGRPTIYGVVGSVRLLVTIAMAIACVQWFGATAEALLWAVAMAGFVSALLGAWAMGRTISQNADATSGRRPISLWELLRYGLKASPSLAVVILMLNADRVLLGYYASAEEVARYAAHADLARQLVYPVIGALSVSILPTALTRLEAHGMDEARQGVSRDGSVALWIALPLVLTTIIAGADIAALLLPSDYLQGGSALMPLFACAAFLLGARLVLADPLFHLQAQPGWIGLSAFIGLIAWVVSFIWLAPEWKGIGAGVAGLLGSGVALAVALSRLGDTPASGAKYWPFILSVGVAVAALVSLQVTNLQDNTGAKLLAFVVVMLSAAALWMGWGRSMRHA